MCTDRLLALAAVMALLVYVNREEENYLRGRQDYRHGVRMVASTRVPGPLEFLGA